MGTLAVGMTVGLRVNHELVYDYCIQAVSSFREAGFKEPLHMFVEPQAGRHIPDPAHWNLVVHKNKKTLGCFPNFKRGAKFLIDNTDADWILMLQDDAVWRADAVTVLQAAIDEPKYQGVGFLSPYTGKAMVSQAAKERFSKTKDVQRWVNCRFHNKAFWGAVAMCFPRNSLIRMQTKGTRYIQHKHPRKLDVVVGNTMRRDLNLAILVAVPSLVDHIGSWSTLGRHRLKGNQWGRRGFAFSK